MESKGRPRWSKTRVTFHDALSTLLAGNRQSHSYDDLAIRSKVDPSLLLVYEDDSKLKQVVIGKRGALTRVTPIFPSPEVLLGEWETDYLETGEKGPL